jgi:hypothetical protein
MRFHQQCSFSINYVGIIHWLAKNYIPSERSKIGEAKSIELILFLIFQANVLSLPNCLIVAEIFEKK